MYEVYLCTWSGNAGVENIPLLFYGHGIHILSFKTNAKCKEHGRPQIARAYICVRGEHSCAAAEKEHIKIYCTVQLGGREHHSAHNNQVNITNCTPSPQLRLRISFQTEYTYYNNSRPENISHASTIGCHGAEMKSTFRLDFHLSTPSCLTDNKL